MLIVMLFLFQYRAYAVEDFDARSYAANQILFVSNCLAGGVSGSASAGSNFNPNDVFNENAAKVMTGLLNAGYSQAETAGVIGSLKGESGASNPG